MLWCAWEAGQQTPPPGAGSTPRAGKRAPAGGGEAHQCRRPGISSSHRPAKEDRWRFPAPAAPCQEGTAASLHLCCELSFIDSFALQIYHSISLCPRSQQPQPSCSPAKGLTPTPGNSASPLQAQGIRARRQTLTQPRLLRREDAWGTEKQPLVLGLCAVTFGYLRFSERVLQPFCNSSSKRDFNRFGATTCPEERDGATHFLPPTTRVWGEGKYQPYPRSSAPPGSST